MKVVKESHLDHQLTEEQLAFILEKFQGRDSFFIETFTLPEHLGTLPCALYGPLMGDERIREPDVTYLNRNGREHLTRFVSRGMRQVREVTIIAGPHNGDPCVLYTVYGGPLAPMEPGDPNCKNLEESKEFWSKHALSDSLMV